MIKICFVCLGNICRSPMAEFVFKKLVHDQGLEQYFTITSLGTSNEEYGNTIHPGTVKELKRHHIPYTMHYAKQLERDDYFKFDYFIGMDLSNVSSMKRLFSWDPLHKVYRFLDFTPLKRDIYDPWYTLDFESTYNDIEMASRYLLQYLLEKENGSF